MTSDIHHLKYCAVNMTSVLNMLSRMLALHHAALLVHKLQLLDIAAVGIEAVLITCVHSAARPEASAISCDAVLWVFSSTPDKMLFRAALATAQNTTGVY
jgi:hypothetical protein